MEWSLVDWSHGVEYWSRSEILSTTENSILVVKFVLGRT